MPNILFAGYKVPHPLEPYFIIKIQTDGSISPQDILEKACAQLIATMSSLESKFKREFAYNDGGEQGVGGYQQEDGGAYQGQGGAGGAWGGGGYEDF